MKRNKSLFTLILLTISIFTNSILYTQAETEYSYTGGVIETDWEDMEQHLYNGNISTYVTLPVYVDNSDLFPPPGNQENSKSCLAWAFSYALKSSQEYLKRNWSINTNSHNFSPTYTYDKINNGVNNGATLPDALDSLQTDGACPISYYPINNNSFVDSSDIYDNAAANLYKIDSYDILFTRYLIKNQIANGNGVVIAIRIYNDLKSLSETNDIYDYIEPNESPASIGHAVCLVGYDDNKNAFKLINSWGTSWGIDGYGWISYDFMENTEVNMLGRNMGIIINTPDNDDYLMGDINNDTVINSVDAQLALQISSNSISFTSRQYVLTDVDGNGTVTAADARNILNYASGTLTKFPLYE